MLKRLSIALLFASPVAAQPAAGAIRVLRHAPPTIDGQLTPAEWDGTATTASGGLELRFSHDDRYLFVAVRGQDQGFPSICVTRGDTTRVLHASSALGAGVYTRADTASKLASGFNFGLRARGDAPDIDAQRAAYLAANGWVASNAAMSQTTREYQIPLAFLGDSRRIALGYFAVTAAGERVIPWPSTVADGCTNSRMVSGYLPEQIAFDNSRWAVLDIVR